MEKLLFTTVMAGAVRAAFEQDLQRFEDGGRDGFRFMEYVEDAGMYVPFNWIDKMPEWKDRWDEFMSGQTVCAAGIYHRDVQHFLNVVESEANSAAD